MKKPELAIPKSDSKKERKDAHRASQAVRKANREECLRLDGNLCRNGHSGCKDKFGLEYALRDSHHLLGKIKDNRYDGVEFRITLCRACHQKLDKNRLEMIKVLQYLKRTLPTSVFRWAKGLKELKQRYG